MPLTISLVNDEPREAEARAQLERLLDRYDLHAWEYTSEIQIDAHAAPHSHPVLTLNTRYLDDDHLALTTYLHEQLHWFSFTRPIRMVQTRRELQERYPSVPGPEDGGGADAFSTYLHLVICTLEYASLQAVIGEAAALTVMERFAHPTGQIKSYRWIYATIVNEWSYFEDLLTRREILPEGVAPSPPSPA